VYRHIYSHCIKNNLQSPKNSGFKKGEGGINQILGLTDIIYKAFESRSEVAMVFLDISRTFDRVWHEGLLFKLKSSEF